MVDEQPPATDGIVGGAAEAAARWLEDIVVRRDIAHAWTSGTDPDYRLALVQAVIFLNRDSPLLANQDRNELAHHLSDQGPGHPLWPSFAGLMMEEFLHDLGEIGVDRSTTVATKPGHALVLFAPGEEGLDGPLPEMGPRGLLMRLRGGRWLVAGLSERPAVPGWPPDLGY